VATHWFFHEACVRGVVLGWFLALCSAHAHHHPAAAWVAVQRGGPEMAILQLECLVFDEIKYRKKKHKKQELIKQQLESNGEHRC
jgi:hypothetical protein